MQQTLLPAKVTCSIQTQEAEGVATVLQHRKLFRTPHGHLMILWRLNVHIAHYTPHPTSTITSVEHRKSSASARKIIRFSGLRRPGSDLVNTVAVKRYSPQLKAEVVITCMLAGLAFRTPQRTVTDSKRSIGRKNWQGEIKALREKKSLTETMSTTNSKWAAVRLNPAHNRPC
jgi:hypothetical protein